MGSKIEKGRGSGERQVVLQGGRGRGDEEVEGDGESYRKVNKVRIFIERCFPVH